MFTTTTTSPTLSQRLMSRTGAAILLAGLGLGLSFGASVAEAQPPSFSQDPSTARMVCGKNGGSYAPPTDVSGSTCVYPDGSVTLCDLNNNCTFYPPDRPRIAGGKPVIGGNAPDVTAGVAPLVSGAAITGLK